MAQMAKEAELGPSPTRWIVSDHVLTSAAAEPRPLAIGVTGAVITELADAKAVRAAAATRVDADTSGGQAEVLDFGARPLLPSFVNAHVHLGMAPLRGITSRRSRSGNVVSDVFFEVERHLSSDDVFAFTRLGAFESLLSGVGEVWDHYYHGEAVARALLEVGLSGVVAPTLQDISGPFASAWEAQLEATRRIHDSPAFAEAGIFAALGPHASDTVSDSLFERAAALSHRFDLPVHLHLAQSAEETRVGSGSAALVARVSQLLAGCPVVMAHGLFLSRADVQALVRADWTLAACPLSQVQFGFLSAIVDWQRSGGRLAVGTDCVASNDALSVQRELPWLAAQGALATSFGRERETLLTGGELFEVEALEGARKLGGQGGAIDGTELLGLGLGEGLPSAGSRALRRGSIELGAAANFQVLDPDAPELFPDGDLPRRLAYGDTSGALHAMIVAGRMVGKAGAFRASLIQSLHYREAREEAVRRRAELWSRAGLG